MAKEVLQIEKNHYSDGTNDAFKVEMADALLEVAVEMGLENRDFLWTVFKHGQIYMANFSQ